MSDDEYPDPAFKLEGQYDYVLNLLLSRESLLQRIAVAHAAANYRRYLPGETLGSALTMNPTIYSRRRRRRELFYTYGEPWDGYHETSYFSGRRRL